MDNKKPGLKLVYSKSSDGENIVLTARVETAVGNYSRNFITTPEIRGALEKFKLPLGGEVGNMVVVYDPKEKLVNWRTYFPIPHTLGTPTRSFRNKGIASLIEAHVNREIERNFPAAKNVVQINPSDRRKTQLKKRGFSTYEINKGISSKDFSKAMRDKLADDIRKARARRRA